MVIEFIEDVFVEVADNSLEAKVFPIIAYVKEHIEFIKTHDYEERDGYDWRILSDLVDATWNTEYHNLVYGLYCDLNSLEDVLYREYAEADFLEYASHMNEPNFDWDFYSDWHKDIYGYRPRR